jgi:hypothetical protein
MSKLLAFALITFDTPFSLEHMPFLSMSLAFAAIFHNLDTLH